MKPWAVCVCVCVCVGGGREGGRERERERDSQYYTLWFPFYYCSHIACKWTSVYAILQCTCIVFYTKVYYTAIPWGSWDSHFCVLLLIALVLLATK